MFISGAVVISHVWNCVLPLEMWEPLPVSDVHLLHGTFHVHVKIIPTGADVVCEEILFYVCY